MGDTGSDEKKDTGLRYPYFDTYSEKEQLYYTNPWC